MCLASSLRQQKAAAHLGRRRWSQAARWRSVREGRRSVRGWLCMYPKSSGAGFGHFVEWVLALGLYRLVRGAMLVLLLASAGWLHSHSAAFARVPLVPAGERPLAQRLAGADLVGDAPPPHNQRGWRHREPF